MNNPAAIAKRSCSGGMITEFSKVRWAMPAVIVTRAEVATVTTITGILVDTPRPMRSRAEMQSALTNAKTKPVETLEKSGCATINAPINSGDKVYH